MPLISFQYMDDVVFAVVGGAREISGRVAGTAATVCGEFRRHRPLMNMKQSKSEALIVCRGGKEAENKLFRVAGVPSRLSTVVSNMHSLQPK